MIKNNKKAVIFGLKSYKISINEKIFLKKNKPWGIILFSRNIKNLIQLKKLVNEIKKIFKDKQYPIIDVEGGKVSRLNKIFDLSIFSQNYFGKIFRKNKKKFLIYYKIYIDSVSKILKDSGININTVPVLDVRRKKSHTIIGNRSYSENVSEVTTIGNICVDFYHKNKIATVIKHIPGHGLANVDSHYNTPIITKKKNELLKKDFKAFKKSKSNIAMTAHVIYKDYDPSNTVTHSKVIIKKVIRDHINFKGLLISDDISMKSLKYNIIQNTLFALKAGCNLILHCNGNIKEMKKIAKVIPNIDLFTQKKTSDLYNFLG